MNKKFLALVVLAGLTVNQCKAGWEFYVTLHNYTGSTKTTLSTPQIWFDFNTGISNSVALNFGSTAILNGNYLLLTNATRNLTIIPVSVNAKSGNASQGLIGSPTNFYVNSFVVDWANSNVIVDVGFGIAQDCTKPVFFNVVNTSDQWRIYSVGRTVAGTYGVNLAGGGAKLVPPGGTFTWSNTVPCANASSYQLYASTGNGGDNLQPTGVTNQYDNPVQSQNGTTTTNLPPPNYDSLLGTNLLGSGVDLSSDTNFFGRNDTVWTNADQVAQTAHADAAQAAAQAHSDVLFSLTNQINTANGIISHMDAGARMINDSLNRINENTLAAASLAHIDATNIADTVAASGGGGGGTNGVSVSVNVTNINVNNISTTNLAQESTLAGMSNILGSWTTNHSEEAGEARMWGLIPGSATNAAAATDAATGILGGVEDTLSDWVALVASPPTTSDPGHTGSWEMNFCGQTIDLDPVNRFPAIFAFSYGLWQFVLLASFLYFVAKLYWDAVKTAGHTQTGGVPDLEVMGGGEVLTFGGMFGGNFIGVAVALVIPAVFLALFVVMITLIFVPIAQFSGMFDALQSLLSSLPAMTTRILTNAIPVNLALSLFCSAVTLYFTMSKAYLIFSGASRYLWGK